MPERNPQNRPLDYTRLSSYGQTLDAQLEQLLKADCTKIYREKATGARPDRRELLKLLKILAPGDVVTVTRIARLARSTFGLFAIVKRIVDAKAQFRSLAEPWANTSTSTGGWCLPFLGGLADAERDLIRTPTAEGRERAKAGGQHIGRPPKLAPQQQKEPRRRPAEGATFKELAKSYNVGRATISRLASRNVYPRLRPEAAILWGARGNDMAQGFIDPESEFAATVRNAAAAVWGKRAVDLAKAAGQSVDAVSLGRWLDEAEPQEAKALRATNPALHREQYDEAAAAAQEFASIQGIWDA